MAEYIERMSAIATACKGCNKEFPNEPCEPADCSIQQGLFKITTADVVEVVRCGKCSHWNNDIPHHEEYGSCDKHDFAIFHKNHYCSFGEKMDGKGDDNG